MDKDYLNFLERMGSFGMELGDQSDEIQHHGDEQMPVYRAAMSNTDSIEHHGVKGQKWGVRRRVQALVGKTGQVPKSAAAASEAREKSWKKVYANRASMSTPQLREKVNRLTLENQLKQQVSIANQAQKSAARQIITNVGTQLIKNVAQQQGQQLLKEALTKMAS